MHMRFFCVRCKKEMEGLAPIDTLRRRPLDLARKYPRDYQRAHRPPLPRRRPRAGDPGPHPGPGTQTPVLDCGGRPAAIRQDGGQLPAPRQRRTPTPRRRDRSTREKSPASRASGAEVCRSAAPFTANNRRLSSCLLLCQGANNRQLEAHAVEGSEHAHKPEDEKPKVD